MPGKKWRSEELAYLAGIIDGEGSIEARIGSRRPSDLSIRLVVGNVHRGLIEYLLATWGGTMRTQVHGRYRPIYTWNLSLRAARPVMEAVLPYLIVKRRQVELVLELASLTGGATGPRPRLTELAIARRRRIIAAMKEDRRARA